MNALRIGLLVAAVVTAALAQRPAFRPPASRPPAYRPPSTPMPGAFRPSTPGTFRPPAPRPPAEVAKGLTRAGARPDAVFRELRVGEGRALPDAVRVQVSREAVRSLATRLDAVRDPVVRLNEIRAVQAEANGLPDAVRLPLERLHQTARRQLLAEALDAVRGPAESGHWADATGPARTWQAKLRSNRPAAELKGIAADHAEAEAACREVAEVADRLAALDELLAALGPRGAARDLAALEPARLPDALRRGQETLRGVAALREAAAKKWGASPDVAAIKDSLARLERAPDAGPTAAKRAALDLAVKALVEGHPDAALHLLPADVPAEHAAAALRDLKALTLGGGTVETWPAGGAATGTRPPPGLEPLVPEAKREGWRPPVREKASAGLPLEPAEKAGAKAREAATRDAAQERARLHIGAEEAVRRMNALHARVTAPEREERKRFGSVEYRLGRRLTAGERALVRDWLDDGKPADDVLPRLAVADDEDRFLAEVARLLGRELTPEERGQARAMRRDGRRAAEAAELLRS